MGGSQQKVEALSNTPFQISPNYHLSTSKKNKTGGYYVEGTAIHLS